MSTSMRSPMPRPGSPQNHSTLRSLTIWAGRTPKSDAACVQGHLASGLDVGHQGQQPGDLVPRGAHRTGSGARPTMSVSRPTTLSRSSGGDDHDDVGAVAEHLVHERLACPVRRVQPVPAGRRLRTGSLGGRRVSAQRRARALADEHLGGAVGGRLRRQRGGDRPQVGALGHLERAGCPVVGDHTDHPGEPEDPRRVPIHVVAHDVPAATEGDHPPRPQVTRAVAGARWRCGSRSAPGSLVRVASQSGSKAGSSAVSCGCTTSSAVRSTLTPAAFSLTRASEVAAARPACCHTRAARPITAASVGGEVDLRQLEGGPLDPVAGLVLEGPVDVPDLDRDAEGAQLLLVPLEHLLERVVADLAVCRRRRARSRSLVT